MAIYIDVYRNTNIPVAEDTMRNKILDYAIHLKKIEAEVKWTTFCRQHFQMHFLEWKLFNFDQYFTAGCSWGSNLQYSIIGSDNGLAPTRRQAIIWTKDGQFTDAYMRNSASMTQFTSYDSRSSENLCEWSWIAFKGCWLRMCTCINYPCQYYIYPYQKFGYRILVKQLIHWYGSEWFSLTAFLRTADVEVHIVYISRVIIAYTLESLSFLT